MRFVGVACGPRKDCSQRGWDVHPIISTCESEALELIKQQTFEGTWTQASSNSSYLILNRKSISCFAKRQSSYHLLSTSVAGYCHGIGRFLGCGLEAQAVPVAPMVFSYGRSLRGPKQRVIGWTGIHSKTGHRKGPSMVKVGENGIILYHVLSFSPG